MNQEAYNDLIATAMVLVLKELDAIRRTLAGAGVAGPLPEQIEAFEQAVESARSPEVRYVPPMPEKTEEPE